jgi:hypothetical protein
MQVDDVVIRFGNLSVGSNLRGLFIQVLLNITNTIINYRRNTWEELHIRDRDNDYNKHSLMH